MLDVLFRPAAENDLATIADYTNAQWGDRQARTYVEEIRRKIIFAAEFPGIGSSIPDLPDEYRKTAVGSHRIIFRCTEQQLVVVRIIHEREDIRDDPDEFW